jgi:hypothetical protein
MLAGSDEQAESLALRGCCPSFMAFIVLPGKESDETLLFFKGASHASDCATLMRPLSNDRILLSILQMLR